MESTDKHNEGTEDMMAIDGKQPTQKLSQQGSAKALQEPPQNPEGTLTYSFPFQTNKQTTKQTNKHWM
jgi:hypothetical protein